MSKGVKIKKLKYNLLMNIKIENNDNENTKNSKPSNNNLDCDHSDNNKWII